MTIERRDRWAEIASKNSTFLWRVRLLFSQLIGSIKDTTTSKSNWLSFSSRFWIRTEAAENSRMYLMIHYRNILLDFNIPAVFWFSALDIRTLSVSSNLRWWVFSIWSHKFPVWLKRFKRWNLLMYLQSGSQTHIPKAVYRELLRNHRRFVLTENYYSLEFRTGVHEYRTLHLVCLQHTKIHKLLPGIPGTIQHDH